MPKAELKGAVGRYVGNQGNQVGTEALAEILLNLVYEAVPDLADELLPKIALYVKHNGNQAGLQELTEILKGIIEEGILDTDVREECSALVNAFVRQNGIQTGLPILVGDNSYRFDTFLCDLIDYLIP